MRFHRFITSYEQIGKDLVISDEKILHQITRVFRMNAGDRIIICDGHDTDYVCKISEIHSKKLVAKIVKKNKLPHDDRKIIIALALLKKESFEYALEKMTEVGVTDIIPLVTARVVKTGFKRDRLEDILREATEQSGRVTVPELHEPVLLEKFLVIPFEGKRFVADFDGKKATELFGSDDHARMIFIGPEGGWDDTERELFENHGVEKLSLGDSVLRAETAATIAGWCAKNN